MKKNESGFTIIEMLIAISIFSIGLLAIGSMQWTSSKSVRRTNWQTIANMMAQEQIERIHNQSVSDPSSVTFVNDAFEEAETPDGKPVKQRAIYEQFNVEGECVGTEQTIPTGGFLRETRIQQHYLADDSISDFSMQVIVTVKWHRDGAQREITFDTITRGIEG